MPDRPALAQTIQRVVQAGARFTGASDHLVSEAMYLRDPEGNGIELYRDRPRSAWEWQGENVAMDTLALDVDAVMAELPAEPDEGMRDGTIVGHVHLNIGDIAESEAFYSGVVGFDVMVRGYPGALFVAAGGYHHHIGLNTWNGDHAPAPPAGALGLRSFDVVLPDAAALDDVLGRVAAAGIAVEHGRRGHPRRRPVRQPAPAARRPVARYFLTKQRVCFLPSLPIEHATGVFPLPLAAFSAVVSGTSGTPSRLP